MTFEELRLAEPLLRALKDEGYSIPTPIQAQAIPHVLEGKDLLGIAQTGTGKTAAFALPILHKILSTPAVVSAAAAGNQQQEQRPERADFRDRSDRGGDRHRRDYRDRDRGPIRKIRALILAPTRELAQQIFESFQNYGRHSKLRFAVIFGGVGQHPQVAALRSGVDVVVATPGRLLDLCEQGHVKLDAVDTFILDEADHMLDMGFVPDVRRIAGRLPQDNARQTLMFSATMPYEVRQLANSLLRDPVKIEVTPVASTVERIDQSVFFVDRRNKPALMIHLLENTSFTRSLVFSRTKHGADKIVRMLRMSNINAEAIHGNKSQSQRQRTLENFRSGKTAVLIASDIAARGIDIDAISHVINYDLPEVPETYVHRIGRTGRAGSTGTAISFCDYDERGLFKAIERTTKAKIAVRDDHPKYGAPIILPRVEDIPGHPDYQGGSNDRPQGQRRFQGLGNGNGNSGGQGRRSFNSGNGQAGQGGQRRDGNRGFGSSRDGQGFAPRRENAASGQAGSARPFNPGKPAGAQGPRPAHIQNHTAPSAQPVNHTNPSANHGQQGGHVHRAPAAPRPQAGQVHQANQSHGKPAHAPARGGKPGFGFRRSNPAR